MVPFGKNIYGFAFLTRDEENVSRTPRKKSLAVSELCQEYILRTCTEMVYELCDVIYRQKSTKRGRKKDSGIIEIRARKYDSMTGITPVEDT
jgi:hypothetical protein